jgi:gas vesicle protein
MKLFFALMVGVVIGAVAFWYLGTSQGKSTVQSTGQQIESAAKPALDAIQEKLKVLDLRTNDIKDELAKTGQVVRRKAKEAGQAISDATADARVTAAVKARLVTTKDLSGMGISVNTTAGVVTLSGAVSSTEEIGKAMLVTMETDGVREVISTLQVKAQKQ